MNKVEIKQIQINNFKGIAKAVFNFNSGINKISAENGAGKTTVKNAFEWCLCQNVKDILPMLNNKEIPNLTTNVIVDLNINNCDYKLERISRGKYQLNKESNTMNKVSNECTYKIDDIELKEKDYKEKLANILGNGTFENLVMLTDKEYFNTDTTSFKWNNRRKLLYDLCGVKNAIQGIVEQDMFNGIKDYILKGYATSDIKSMLAKEKKGYKDTQNKNNILIEQKILEVNELSNIDFDNIEKQLKTLNNKLDKLQTSSNIENQSEQLNELQSKLLECTREMSTLQTKFQIEYSNQERLVKTLYNDCKLFKLDVDVANDNVSTLQVKLNNIADMQETCPICGRKFDQEYIDNINKTHQQEKNDISDKLEIKKLELIDATNKYNKKVEEYNMQLEIMKTMQFIPPKELEDSVLATKLTIEQVKAKNLSNLSNEQVLSLKNQILSLTKELGKKELLEKSKNMITMWKNQNKEIADKIILVERKENALVEYVRQETNIISKTINDKFSNGITWALFKETYKNGDGGLEEDCVCMYNNKRYSSLSNGERNIANLEVVKTLQNYFGVNLPIFSDNAESITIPYNLDNQLIELFAKKGCKLDNVVKIESIY